MDEAQTQASPHAWVRKGWRWWICRRCYAPWSMHPRNRWVRARPLHDNRYLSVNAPHFDEGW